MRPPSRVPLVIGHRGASGYRPEHTRSAYELAFALGADAVEPDLVATRDGVLVVRHENEISGTTDIADHPEFADRRTTKTIDGQRITGWFTEDFDWAELARLRCVERLPQLRRPSTSFDRAEPMLRLSDVLELLEAARRRTGRDIGLVAEVKYPGHFASIGRPLEPLVARELASWHGRPEFVVESFELSSLTTLRSSGLEARYIYLVERTGAAPDQVARHGERALSYAAQLTPAGLARLGDDVDGVSVAKELLLRPGRDGIPRGRALVARAHEAGLEVFTWTLRPENRFLAPAHRRGRAASSWGDWRAEFALVLDMGVDGIFVDHPDLGIAARDS